MCCAPCSPYVVEQLRQEYDLTLYFYNPNIHPEKEYTLRLDELRRWAEGIDTPLIVGEYDAERWFAATKGYEGAPERGARCEICFDMRLGETARKAGELGADMFGTVLSVSPHKDAVVINRVGAKAGETAGVEFMAADWKKKDGFKITAKMGRELGFYRQDYCGCVYSRRGDAARKTAGANG